MGLFNLKDTQVILDPNVLAIPEFKALWDRDKTKEKDQATKELSYVFFLEDFNSPYSVIPEHLRGTTVKEDFMKDKSWSEDDMITVARKKYRLLSETPTIRFVKSVRNVIDRMTDYLNTVEIDSKSFKGVQDSIDKVGKTLAGYTKIEDAAKKELSGGSSRTFGNRDVGDFER